ncbi:MAG: polysaccharide deacetylase family protein [Candidatus Ratteibacteria bacterium]|jgi:peptidoglycan/xylan/chitin deacetylase (PgdA/CDA1 family)
MILAYHRINPWYSDDALSVTPASFSRHIDFLLSKGFSPLSLAKYIREGYPAKTFCISFDDGYADNFHFAWPILQKYRIRPIIFLSLHYIGTEKLLPRYHDKEKDRFLSWKEVQTLSREGVDFGSHGLTHPKLTSLDRKKIWIELFQSKKELERNLGKKIEFFSYPFGDFNDAIANTVKNAGYTAAVVTSRALKKPDPYRIPRVGIYGHNSFLVYRIKVWKTLFEKIFS